jgi:hypothetical protein
VGWGRRDEQETAPGETATGVVLFFFLGAPGFDLPVLLLEQSIRIGPAHLTVGPFGPSLLLFGRRCLGGPDSKARWLFVRFAHRGTRFLCYYPAFGLVHAAAEQCFIILE